MNRLNMTRYAVTHPVGIIMIVLFFVTLGLYSYYRLGVELYPKINTPYVVVSVTYDGADAESVEQQVTKPVEDALSSVSDVKHITSKSRTGKSQVTLELNFDADVDAAAQSGMALPPYAGPEAAVQAVFCDEHQIFVVDLETVRQFCKSIAPFFGRRCSFLFVYMLFSGFHALRQKAAGGRGIVMAVRTYTVGGPHGLPVHCGG